MTKERKIYERYSEITKAITGDHDMIVKTLINYFGSADSLWYCVNNHITDLIEVDDLDYAEDCIQEIEKAYNKAISQRFEEEVLNEI